jgi:hypothetical protein
MAENPAVIEPGNVVEIGPPSAPIEVTVLEVRKAMNANTYLVTWCDKTRHEVVIHEVEIKRKLIDHPFRPGRIGYDLPPVCVDG